MTIEEIQDNIKEYTLVLLKKGPKYHGHDVEVQEQNQAAHLSYLMELRANGAIAMVGPVMDGGEVVGMTVFNIAEKEAVKTLVENDPGVESGRFTYQMSAWFSFPGDVLG